MNAPRRNHRRRRRIAAFLLCLVTTYIASYAVLSARGGYVLIASGAKRFSYGFAVPDRFVWQPATGTGYWFRDATGTQIWDADLLGYLFQPPMWFDQSFVHRPVPWDGTDHWPARLRPTHLPS